MTTPDDTFREHQQDAAERHGRTQDDALKARMDDVLRAIADGRIHLVAFQVPLGDNAASRRDILQALNPDADDGTGRHPTNPPHPTEP